MSRRVPSLASEGAPEQSTCISALGHRNRFSLLAIDEDDDEDEPEENGQQQSEHGQDQTPESRNTSNQESSASSTPSIAEPNEKAASSSPAQDTQQYEIGSISLFSHVEELLRFRGRIDGHDAVFLIDSGSTHDFISAEFVRRHGVKTHVVDEHFSVTLADGRTTAETRRCTAPLKVTISNESEQQSFTVFSLMKYDAILGRPWLTKNNPQINYQTNEVKIGSKEPWTARVPTESLREQPASGIEVNLISGKQARHALRKGDDGFLAWVTAKDPMEGRTVDNTDRNNQERMELFALLEEYKDVFPDELPAALPPRRSIDHRIEILPGSRPPARPPFRLSKPLLDELQTQLGSLLEKGLIEPSRSPFGAPVFFVKKSDGSLRLVCDWRELNKITVKNEACLPNIDDIFDTVQGSKFFTKLDLRSGYNQVRIDEEDVPKTAINTPLGHFQFKVMGFGLCNAPATFQSLMNDVLRPYLRKFVVVFLDDILIFSRSWKEHLEHVHLVLEALRKHQLFGKLSKCLFGATETLYLGHCISGSTIAPDPQKLLAVEGWPIPKNVSQVRSFLGFANYFRRFVPHYAELAKPLDLITGKNSIFSWNEERQQAFEDIKSALVSAPVLRLADVSKPFRVHTDASDTALGAVLFQEHDDCWLPVAYASRKLTPAEKNYTIMERETLAVVFALNSWRLYLFKHFDVFTDNRGVVYLQTKQHLSKRELRWTEFLADFNFSTHHIPGKQNCADSLTRQGDVTLGAEVYSLEFSLDLHPDYAEEIAKGYDSDPESSHIIRRLSASKDDAFHDRYLWDETRERLYLIESSPARLCVPKGPIRLQLLQENHDCPFSGHQGRDRTFWNLSRHFFWPGMGRSVKEFVKSCESCQRNKSARLKVGLLQPLPVPARPWENLSMDFVMGLPRTDQNHDAIFTFVDRLTKYVHLIPTTSSVDAEGAARLYVDHVFSAHGLSKSIVSDRDPRFTSAFFKEVFALLEVKLQLSTANHPQTDGMTERMNRVIEECLRTFVNHRQTNWDQFLPLCQFAINNSRQASTDESPFFLNSGQHPLTPSSLVDARTNVDSTSPSGEWLKDREEALKTARDAMLAAQARQAFYSDRGRKVLELYVGDKVMVHRDFLVMPEARNRPCDKLRPRWYGPFTVTAQITTNAFKLDLPHQLKCHPVFNITALKKYHQSDFEGRYTDPPPPITDLDGFERYIVEKILAHRRNRRGLQFLVKWVGYPDATWEPEAFLKNEVGDDLVPLQSYKNNAWVRLD